MLMPLPRAAMLLMLPYHIADALITRLLLFFLPAFADLLRCRDAEMRRHGHTRYALRCRLRRCYICRAMLQYV